jgi:hypothetical protein
MTARPQARRAAEGCVYRLRCVFVPQAWVRDNAIGVDPEGPTVWEADYGAIPAERHSYESDALREHHDAPAWIRDWAGPFEVDFLVRYTVVGTYTDSNEPDGKPQRYASYCWADDPDAAEEQAFLEAGDSLQVAAVLVGEATVAA